VLDIAIKNAAVKAVGELLGLAGTPTTELLAASLREMLLRIDTVSTITGLSIPTLYRLMSQGNFPRPLKITGHARAWKLSEVMQWIDSLERDAADPHDAA
jgi:prophage regulatory protein